MDIHVFSEIECREQVQSGLNSNVVIISIRDVGKKDLVGLKREGVIEVLNVHFDDVVSGPNVMTKSQAKEIKKFVKRYIKANNPPTFFVHCFAGQSRSYAVGKYIKDKTDGRLILHSKNVDYNPYVYDLLKKRFL